MMSGKGADILSLKGGDEPYRLNMKGSAIQGIAFSFLFKRK